MRLLGIGLCCLLLAVVGCGDRARPVPSRPEAREAEFWSRIDEIARSTGAREVTTLELMNRNSSPITLDVRTPAEYAAGHIPGAVRVDADAKPESIAALMKTGKQTPIVAYCTVGQRSGDLVRALEGAGYENARNLRGGIIAWVNAGGSLEAEGPAKVHTWSREWGRYVKPGVETLP